MATISTNVRIENVKDTTANWERANPILLDGEIGIEVKPNGQLAIKIGNGITHWTELDYVNSLTVKEIETLLDKKVDKIDGMGLSQNNYSNEDKAKLNSLGSGVNFKGYVSSVELLPTNATAGDMYFANGENSATLCCVYSDENGWETFEIFSVDLTNYIQRDDIDTELNTASTNPIQNKAVALHLEAHDSQLTQLQEKVETNIADIASHYAQIQENKTNIGVHEAEISTLNNNVNSLTTGLQTAFNSINTKIDDTSRGYVPIRYITESKDFNTDFMLSADDPNTVIFSCAGETLSANSPFGSRTLPYILIAERVYFNASQADFIKYTCMAVEYAGTEYANIIEYQRFYKGGVNPIWTEWETPNNNVDLSEYYTKTEIDEKTNEITSEVDGLTASVDHMSVYKADTTTVNGVISNVSALTERVTTNETNISSNASNIALLEAKTDATNTVVGDLSNNLQNAFTQIDNNTEEITSLIENVQANTADIGEHTNEIAVLNNNVSSLQSGLSATVNRVSTNEVATDSNTNNINTVENEVNVLQARVDNIVATSDTATEENAELIDMRVGADGVTYTTAGTAVRTQFINANNNLKSIAAGGIKKEISLLAGGINASGVNFSNTNYMRTAGYFETQQAINDGAIITPIPNANIYACYFNYDGTTYTYATRELIRKDYEFNVTYPYFRLSFYRPASMGSADEKLFLSAVEWYTQKTMLTGNNIDFVDKKYINLFDGNYISGIKLGGNTSPFSIQADTSFNSLALIEVKPNTTYSIIMSDPELEDGYYYTKIAEIYAESMTGATLVGANNTLLYANTANYAKAVVVTTSETATHIAVQTSKAKQPFLQIVEGIQLDFTVDNYELQTIYSPNEKLNIYSKEEVNKLFEKKTTTFSKSGNVITITTKKAQYTFKRVTNNSINIDTWRLYAGKLNAGNNRYVTMWSDSDAEGAIKIVGEDDFVCGYHGDEIMTDIKIFVDGVELDLSVDYDTTEFKELHIYVTSDVYHCNTSTLASTQAFERNKMLIFKGDTVKIGNYFKCLSNLVIERAALCLFQCYYKTSSGSAVLSNYSVNTDYKIYSLDDTTAYPSSSSDMSEAWLSTSYANINFKSLKTSGQNYVGMVGIGFVSSQNRLKFYFDTINTATNVNADDIISSEFEFTIS